MNSLSDLKNTCKEALWKDIPGYEGIYQASTDGQIRTCEGKITSNARYPRRVWKQRILKQKKQTSALGRIDAKISLWKDGTEKTWLVARLVALTWCDGYADNMTVNHKDGNTLNNCCENLEWVSLRKNIQHGFNTGLYRNIQIPVVVIENGRLTMHPSMAAASRALGKNPGYISAQYSKMVERMHKNGLHT